MKKIVFLIAGLSIIAGLVFAETITLNSNETFSKVATQIKFRSVTIDNDAKTLKVRYSWRDADGNNITPAAGGHIMTWTCADSADNPDTPEDETDTCFSDTFGFAIRSQDVGTKLGIGLRTLIWSKMKQDVLTAGNDGTFAESVK